MVAPQQAEWRRPQTGPSVGPQRKMLLSGAGEGSHLGTSRLPHHVVPSFTSLQPCAESRRDSHMVTQPLFPHPTGRAEFPDIDPQRV